jgi:hypothetical protein
MNSILDVEPWSRIRASAKMGDLCPDTEFDGHCARTLDVGANSAMTIGPQASTFSIQRCGPITSIAPPLGSHLHKIPIWRHGTGDAA